MLRSVQKLHGYHIQANDGDIGRVEEFFYDDEKWKIRFLVASTGPWLFGHNVLISTRALGHPDWHNKTFPVLLTKKQIEQSPSIHSKIPASRRQVYQQRPYHEWPVFWTGADGFQFEHSSLLLPTQPPPEPDTPAPQPSPAEKHLQSTRDTHGLRLEARDGEIGRLEDFIVDDEDWRLRYLVVATGGRLSGARVLVSPGWIHSIDWREEILLVDHTVEEIRNSPAYDPAEPINRVYEEVLYDYYGRPRYWNPAAESPAAPSTLKPRRPTMPEEKTRNRLWINPFVDCDCGKDEKENLYRMTYELPGVKKKDVNLKITKEALRLTASKDGTEYVNEFSFACNADVDNVHASLEDGQLEVEVPLDCPDPFNSAKSVEIA